MKKNIYSEAGIVETYQDGDTIHVIWSKLHNANSIYKSCEAQMKAVQQEGVNVVIIDMVNASGTPPMEFQKWFGAVLFPGFTANPNFKGLINVLPASAITKMGANHWKKTASKSEIGFEVYETDSPDTALKLAKELNSKTAVS